MKTVHTERRAARRTLSRLSRLASADGGNSVVEFALLAPMLVIMMLNAVDFSILLWAHMEVDNAAEMGAQAAYTACAAGTLPATGNCSNLNTIVTTAVQSTSLGTSVTLATGSPSEAYDCTIAGNNLQSIGSPPSAMPANCSAAGAAYAANAPGDYVTVGVNYSYAPLFAGLSLAPAQTLAATGMQRLQ